MTEPPASPVLDTVLDTVLRVVLGATGATRGRLVAVSASSDQLLLVAARGGDGGWPSNLVAYVVATGQPQVVASRDSVPASALCAPCVRDDEVVGALELADKAGSASFTIDDLELASLLAGIAAVAIFARPAPVPPGPAQLTGDLGRLAGADPARYDTVARLVQSLLHA